MSRRPVRRHGTQNRPDAGRPRFYGRHAVHAALLNPDRVFRKLWATPDMVPLIDPPEGLRIDQGDAADLARLVPADAPHQGVVLECEPLENPWLGDILRECQGGAGPIVVLDQVTDPPQGLRIDQGDAADLARLVPADAPHQGIVLECEPLENPWLGDILRECQGGAGPIVVLDQVTDPHNVGAVLRSCAAFGAVCLVTQDRHAPPESGALAKAASGALEIVPWTRVTNLARALDEIGEAGFWRIGLTGEAPTTLGQALGTARPALVLGAEGEGMRPNTAAHCDELARLPIARTMESLNVSNAAAIALYASSTR